MALLMLLFLASMGLWANKEVACYDNHKKARFSLRSRKRFEFDLGLLPPGLVERARSRVMKRREQMAEEAADAELDGTNTVRESDKQPLHGGEAMAIPSMQLNPGITGPCSLVECPIPDEELKLPGIRALARRYPKSKWAVVKKPTGQFSNDQGEDYLDAFKQIMLYRSGRNYMGSRIPITTPTVTELQLTGRLPSRSINLGKRRSRTFKHGFRVRYRLHGSMQADPYLGPTDDNMQVEMWTPTAGPKDWVIVFQWRTPPILKTLSHDEYTTHPNELRIRLSQFTDQANAALKKQGSSPLSIETFQYAMYGSPVDRIHEIWVTVDEVTVQTLRQL